MTDTTTWVAQAIREAREQRGWSQSELARQLGRTQTSVSYWEAGKRTPGLDDLLEVSDVLDISIEAFLPPQRARRPVSAVLRATAERLADSELHRAIDELVDEAEQATMPPVQITVSAKTPSHAANELLEKADVQQPPVDVGALAQRCGLLVIYGTFTQSLSGLVFAHDTAAVIGINADHHPNRQRFSLAHELGHFVLGHHQRQGAYEDRFHIDTTEGTPPGFDWKGERTANEFAAELLMPRRFISRAFQLNQDPARLARQFAVSELAMGYRLVNLGLR